MNAFANASCVVLVGLLLTSCGKKETLITPSDVESARQQGQLVSLYEKVNRDLKQASGSREQSLIAIKTQIERQIAADEQSMILQGIEDSRLPSRVVPLTELDAFATRAQSIERFDPDRYLQLLQRIRTERAATQTALSQQLVVVGNTAVSDTLQRLNAQSIAADMAGQGSSQYQEYERQKNNVVNEWMAQADQAISVREYVYAATFLRKILGVDPDNHAAKEKLQEAEQKGFEATFRQALEDSKPDLALAELKRISVSPLFEGVKESLESSITILHDFFVRQSQQQQSKQQLEEAYQSLLKASEIKTIQQQPNNQDARDQLAARLYRAAEQQASQQAYGKQLAYLEMANELSPNDKGLSSALEEARRFLVGYSGTVLLIKDFGQTGAGHSAGKSVPQQLFNWMHSNLAGDVTLITQQQYDSLTTERPGRVMVLEGDILQAGVDTESSDGRRTMRVTTYRDQKPNPEYEEWANKGKKGPMPDEFLTEEHQENVTINEIYVKKTGIISLSFRLLEPNGQVVLTDQARAITTLEGEGNEGISIGEYRLPYRRPQVASDIEVMEALSLQAAQQIGEKLKQTLRADDDRYRQLAERSKDGTAPSDALTYYAYVSAMLSLRKDVSAEARVLARNNLIAAALR